MLTLFDLGLLGYKGGWGPAVEADAPGLRGEERRDGGRAEGGRDGGPRPPD